MNTVLVLFLLVGGGLPAAQPEPWPAVIEFTEVYVVGERTIDDLPTIGQTMEMWGNTVEFLNPPFDAHTETGSHILRFSEMECVGAGPIVDAWDCNCGADVWYYSDGEFVILDAAGADTLLAGTFTDMETGWFYQCSACFGWTKATVTLTSGTRFLALSPTGVPIESLLLLEADPDVSTEDQEVGIMAYSWGQLLVRPGVPTLPTAWGSLKRRYGSMRH